jgi:hypothetical protein
MGMLGNQIAAGQALTIANDSFNGDGSTVAFTLSQTVSSVNDIEVLVDNVQQSPYDSSYSVSGTALTFSGAPSAGTNNVYVIYNASKHITTQQVIPDDGSVHSSKIANSAVTDAKIANSAVTDAKIAGVASSKLTGALPALDGSALTDTGIGPYFFAYKTSGSTAAQSVTNDADNLITLDGSIVSDSGSWASNKFTVPSGKGGTYFLQCQVALYHGSNALQIHTPKIFVNGSMLAGNYAFIDYPTQSLTLRHFTGFTNIVTTLSAGDYVQLYIYPMSFSGSAHVSQGDSQGQKATNIWGMRLST